MLKAQPSLSFNALASARKSARNMRLLIHETFTSSLVMSLRCDNTACIAMLEEPGWRTRYISIYGRHILFLLQRGGGAGLKIYSSVFSFVLKGDSSHPFCEELRPCEMVVLHLSLHLFGVLAGPFIFDQLVVVCLPRGQNTT